MRGRQRAAVRLQNAFLATIKGPISYISKEMIEIIKSEICSKSNILWTDGMASQDRWRLANLVITKNKIAQKQSIKGHI